VLHKDNVELASGRRVPTKNPTQDTKPLNGSLNMSKLPPIRRFPGSSIFLFASRWTVPQRTMSYIELSNFLRLLKIKWRTKIHCRNCSKNLIEKS
jgi:hypothetical protein